MKKVELIKEISRRTGFERAQIETMVEAFMHSVIDEVSDNKEISLRGFRSFMPRKRAAKIARNINKGIAIKLPAHFIPIFKPSKKFSRRVQNSIHA